MQSSFHLFLGQSKHAWESHAGEGEDVVDRDLQLPVCRNAVVKSWGNDIGNKLQKIEKSTCFGVNYRTQKKCCAVI